MFIRRFSAAALTVVAAMLAAPPVSATYGYFGSGYGTRNKGMGGVGLAIAQDSLAAADNPANMVYVGNRADLGVGAYFVVPEYTVTGAPSGAAGTFGLVPGTEEGSFVEVAPNGGYNRMLGEDASVGVSIYSNGGANTSYAADAGNGTGTFYGGSTGLKLQQLIIAPTYSRKINEKSAWGISALIVYQRLAAKGFSHFGGFVSDGTPDSLTNNGTDNSTGLGIKLGVRGEVAPGLTAGATYQPKVKMKRFDKYADLIAQRGRLDVPPVLAAGLAWEPKPGNILGFDIQHIMYEEVPAIGNPFSNLTEGGLHGDPSQLFGGENGVGLGWKNVTVFKLGYQWQGQPGWTWRTGFAYGKNPIRGSEMMFNMVAPAVQDWHLWAGATKQLTEKSDVSLALLYAPEGSREGPNPLEVPGRQNVKITQHELGIEVSWGTRL